MKKKRRNYTRTVDLLFLLVLLIALFHAFYTVISSQLLPQHWILLAAAAAFDHETAPQMVRLGTAGSDHRIVCRAVYRQLLHRKSRQAAHGYLRRYADHHDDQGAGPQ